MVRTDKKDFEDSQKAFHRTNYFNTKLYKQFTKAYKELSKKYERFKEGNQIRINKIWQMNDAEVKALADKIMRADQFIHEQQMFIYRQRTADAFFNFAKAKAAGATNDGAGNNQQNSAT